MSDLRDSGGVLSDSGGALLEGLGIAVPTILRLVCITRQEGRAVPNINSESLWIDALVLTGGTAASFSVPTDLISGYPAVFLRLTSTQPIYVNWQGTAVVPTGNITDGSASKLVLSHLLPQFLVVPNQSDTLSIISGSNCILTIEVFR